MLWTEAELAKERINAHLATEASLLRLAVISVIAPKGEGVKPFIDTLEKLNGR